eukprot:SAG31_NODE_2887_length_4948_cov_3.419468_5_plen_47_part_00
MQSVTDQKRSGYLELRLRALYEECPATGDNIGHVKLQSVVDRVATL